MQRRDFLLTTAALATLPLASSVSSAVWGDKSPGDLQALMDERLPGMINTYRLPGYVGGVYHAGDTIQFATGLRNVATGDPMTTDTAWLLGSVSKVLTTTLLLRYVERGQVELDAPVSRYLPEFELAVPGAAGRITVRQLINHTNGINADTLMPVREFGPNAVKSYVDALTQIGLVFEPGAFIHYTNPGFTLAGRIIEKLSGKPFNRALEDELYAPIGMSRSVTSAEQAMLHRTAVGAFPNADGGFRQTNMFMLPVSAAPAGATEIVTVEDIIAFGRTHLAAGVAPNGNRVLSAELTRAMHTPTFDINTPNAPPMGLGWWLMPLAGTTAWWHGGGSPGGTSSLVVIPEHDLVIAGFGNAPGSALMHDAVAKLVLEEHMGLDFGLPFQPAPATLPMSRYAGVYEHFQTRVTVEPTTDGIAVLSEYIPFDDEHQKFLESYTGGSADNPVPVEYVPVRDNLFAPKSAPLESFAGMYGRLGLLSFHDVEGSFSPSHIQSRLRAMRRTA